MLSYPNRSHGIREDGAYPHVRLMFTDFLRKNCPPGEDSQRVDISITNLYLTSLFIVLSKASLILDIGIISTSGYMFLSLQ